ncbi:MAG: S46 family peptidase [Bacteroidota bacterium]
MKQGLWLIISLLSLQAFGQYEPNPGSSEGMWLPNTIAQQKGEEMKKLGLAIEPSSIYDENTPSLKDGIVVLSGGSCTAEAISAEGLLLTNHHCTYDEVAAISTTDNDILKNGYWPESRGKEPRLEGVTAGFLIKIENITERMLDAGAEGFEAEAEKIIKEAETQPGYKADVKEMYNGLEYYLYLYEVFPDVRLAGVPPQDVGKFGYDTDNWMWPRHTGDFTLLRVYAGPDNKPAEYSADNKPYQPKHFFPISIAGTDEGDFSMIMGYPGSTERYLTSFAIKHRIEQNYPDQIKLRGIVAKSMKEAMDADDADRLKLTGDYSSIMNYYKYFQGASTMLKRNKIVEKRQMQEKAFQAWADADPERKEKYGEILGNIEELHELHKEAEHYYQYLIYTLAYPAAASKGLGLTFSQVRTLDAVLKRAPKEIREQELEKAKEALPELYESFVRSADKKIFLGHIEALYTDMSEELQLESFAEIAAGNKAFSVYDKAELSKKEKKKQRKIRKKNASKWNGMSDLEKILAWADTAYDRSLAANPDRMEAFLNNPDKEVTSNDPLLGLVGDIIGVYSTKAALKLGTFEAQIAGLRRDYIAGMQEMYPDRSFYPDANSTTRFSYGQVKGYSVGDSITYKPFTTTKGIMEKYDPNNPDYQVPEKLRNLIEAGDFGNYKDADGTMHVCFLTTNDITGGNSGSPILNGKGELIGTAFDGNWESMCGDIQVLADVNRTIVADIRYILFIIEKYGESSRLIEEMKIMN